MNSIEVAEPETETETEPETEKAPRRCYLLRGTAEETRAAALRLLERCTDDAVLWVGPEATRFESATRAGVAGRLGGAFDAVVLDLHAGVDADLLALAQGFVWAGGALVLRLAPEGPDPGRARLAVHPFEATDVGDRFVERLGRCFRRRAAIEDASAPAALEVTRGGRATAGQRDAVDRLRGVFHAPDPSLVALTADRGRGKSSALGIALRDAPDAVVTAADPRACAEIFRFATGHPEAPREGPIRFLEPLALAGATARPRVIVVDEAAQLPVPLLQQIVERHPDARIAFATTTRGYEGTGRGFVLRFLGWAARRGRPFARLHLTQPIRYAADDPVEALVFDALALDAELAPADAIDARDVETRALDRDTLARDERLLRDLFGLLVHAHYRTTPSDLHRLLDAPNLAVHAVLSRGRVVAATLLAREGDLPAATCADMASGRVRVRGHALADTLVCHLGRPEAGALRMIRSVRIATHPALRRAGLARALVERVHREHAPDLFGTLFGATPELLAFRRSLGYQLVRIGASRGARTGEPAAVMVRPVSARAARLVAELRGELARDLPLQLELLDAEGELGLAPGLAPALAADLPAPAPLGPEARHAVVRSYAFGPRPYESAARAVSEWVEDHAGALADLDPRERAAVEGRVRRRRGWAEVARAAGYESVPAAMRGLRRAVRALLARVDRP